MSARSRTTRARLRAVLAMTRAGLRSLLDPRREAELAGERVVFRHLREHGYLENLEGKRIAEIGPKHGRDSLLLAGLRPKELVLVDLPEKDAMVQEWLPRVGEICLTRHVAGNLLYLDEKSFRALGQFDLVFCLGVLYHNVEQVRLLRRLFDLCSMNGRVVVESATARDRYLARRNAIELHWPETFRNSTTITHLPSRKAIKAWMEMVGFQDVELLPAYSGTLARVRAVLSGVRTAASQPYVAYSVSGANPPYVAGDAR